MKKKIFVCTLLLALVMLSCIACTPKENDVISDTTQENAGAELKFTPGIYSATAEGMGGEIPVTVEFSEIKIESIVIGKNKETPGLGDIAMESISKEVVETQSLSVDAVAGATISSNALLKAVKDCVTQAGGDTKAMTTAKEKAPVPPAQDVHADIIIAGGGAAGLTAGSYAKYEGVENVILLEKMTICGGSTALSGGVMTRPAMKGDPEGTMSADELMDHFLSYSEGKVDHDMLRMYVDNSPADWSWVYSLEGAENINRFHLVPENAYGTYPDGGGRGLANILESEARKVGVDIRTEHNVVDILQDKNGTVIGLKVINADGAEQNFYADAVILATGGFANNEELLKRFAGESAGKLVEMKGHAGANGDGIIMGEKIGAKLKFGDAWDTSGMNNVWLKGFSTYAMQWSSIMINDEGKRFVREDEMYPRIYEEMVVNQINKGHTGGFWVILGEGFGEINKATDKDIEAAVSDGQLFKCNSIEEIAKVTGLPLENLRKTIDNYIAMGSNDSEFGKAAEYMGKIDPNGPFYVAPTHPVRSGTMGGLVINTKAEVLDTNGNPIPHLYAAGETANASFFDNYYYICGNMVQHAVTTGRAAGENAALISK